MAQQNPNEPQPTDWDTARQAAQNPVTPQERPNFGSFSHPAWGNAFAKKQKPLVIPTPPEADPEPDPEVGTENFESGGEEPVPPPASGMPAGDMPLEEEEEDPPGGRNTGVPGNKGKFIAIDPASIPGMADDPRRPFILIPAHIHQYMPLWGWAAIIATLLLFIAGVILMPGISLDRLANRLGDADEAVVRSAMRQLIMNGDERTVRKLYDVAASNSASLTARFRAVDAMSLINRIPEVDRALLRLELSASTNDQVREAAIAARRQREASRARGGP